MCQQQDALCFLKYLRVLLCTKNYLVSNCMHEDYICDFLNRDKRYILCRVWIIVQQICVYIVTNRTAHVISESSSEDYGFACQIIEKKWNHLLQIWTARPRKVELPSLYCKPVCLPQLFYCRWHHSFIRLLCLLINNIAVGKREAVAFKYRLKSILSCWCQLAPLPIPL